jgi:hypothetical protein
MRLSTQTTAGSQVPSSEARRKRSREIEQQLLRNSTDLFSAKPPGGSGVTALADREVIIAKGALAVMTGHATLAATARMMIQGFGCRDLLPLRQAGAHLMTFIAIDFRLMFVVTEADPECRHELRGSRVAT